MLVYVNGNGSKSEIYCNNFSNLFYNINERQNDFVNDMIKND